MSWDPRAIASAAAKWAAIGVVVATAVVLSWRHYTSLVDSNVRLTTERDQALGRAEGATRVVDQWRASQAEQAAALRDLADAQREAGKYSRELRDVLSKHDLSRLAAAKPRMVEARINAGTDRAMRLLERASQAPGGGPAPAGSAGAPGGAAAVP